MSGARDGRKAPWRRGGAALGSDFRAGRTDPVAALEGCPDRIARLDPALNTVVALDAEAARATARDSAARFPAGLPIGGQFVGRHGADLDLLAFGTGSEASHPAPPCPPSAEPRAVP